MPNFAIQYLNFVIHNPEHIDYEIHDSLANVTLLLDFSFLRADLDIQDRFYTEETRRYL